ncbi:MAG: hypothetical protein KAJ14_02245 [Candidatus Omnitrophica bacterium]|nr:hypothetical protein [Candidatus Omnitrophota bacterium]
MFWFSLRSIFYPENRYVWVQVRIIHETDRAILVDNGRKVWIPKSQIYRIRLRKNTFEIYVRE